MDMRTDITTETWAVIFHIIGRKIEETLSLDYASKEDALEVMGHYYTKAHQCNEIDASFRGENRAWYSTPNGVRVEMRVEKVA